MENLELNNDSHKKRGWQKNLLISAMLICFIVLAFTGILKFREILRYLHIPYDKLPNYQISTIHDWSGLILIILILLHLILQRSWFAYIIKKINLKKIILIGIKIVGLILIFGGSVALIWHFVKPQTFFYKSENIKNLQSIEVQEYHGENLSSVADFRENSIKGVQHIDIANYTLAIDGLVNNPLHLKYEGVLKHDKYSKVVTLNCVEGWSAKILWEGVLIKDLLNEAGIKDTANTVIFYAYDGYTSSLPLDYIIDNDIILAYKMNGVTMPPERGFPFQVIAEDKWGYKWVKWVTKIELSDNPNFKGYWEKAGYNQNGDLNGPKFEN